jgi:cystathionine gamma-synthase
MAGIAAIFDQLPTGSVVALSDDCYQAVVGLAKAGQSRGGWTVHRIAVADTARRVEMCGAADLIWLESPSNPLLTVADLDTICAAPRKRGAILGVDNTFATPLNQRPLALGADVAMQSATKFIGGHSDLLSGIVTVRDANLLAVSRSMCEATLLPLTPYAAHFDSFNTPLAWARWNRPSNGEPVFRGRSTCLRLCFQNALVHEGCSSQVPCRGCSVVRTE